MNRHLDPELATYYAYDLADPKELVEMGRHLGECTECEAEISRLREERRKVLEALEGRESSPDLADRILAGLAGQSISKEPSKNRVRPVWPTIGSIIAAACAIVVLVAVLLYPRTPSHTLVEGSVTLEDGSELIAPTSLPASQRWSIRSIRGQAIFQAADSEPLAVLLPAGQVEAKRARFSIRSTDEKNGDAGMNSLASGFMVTVLAGSVVMLSPTGTSLALSEGDSIRGGGAMGPLIVQETANPEYAGWARFKPGSSVGYQITERASLPGAAPREEKTKETHTLVDFNPNEAIIEIARGNDVRKQHIPARIEKEEGAEKILQEGDEELQVAGRKVKCHFQVLETNQVKVGGQSGYTTVKTWKSPEVPGGVVRRTLGLPERPRYEVEVERWEKK